MRAKLLLAFAAILFSGQIGFAQLPPGSIAPNWTLTDINGVTHTLYDYLDDGKTVILDFSATWCGPCWTYHNSHAMADYWYDHGPDGDNTGFVFFIEADVSTPESALYGGPGSQGNWVAGTPYPIINLTSPQTASDYQIGYFPTIYAICPDKYIYECGQISGQQLSTWRESCTMEASVTNIEDEICFEDGNGAIDVEGSGGYGSLSYIWNNGLPSGPNQTDVPQGVYEVTIKDSNSRSIKISDIEVSGPDSDVSLSLENVTDPDCFGDGTGTIEVSGLGGTPGYTFAWSTGDTGPVLDNVAAGDYMVTVTDDNGCQESMAMSVDEPSELLLSVNYSDANCDQHDGIISLNASGGNGGYNFNIDDGNGFTPETDFFEMPAGTYNIQVMDFNGCITSEEITIDNIPGPDADVGEDQAIDCDNTSVEIEGISDAAGPNINFSWTTEDGNIVSGADQKIALVNAAGTYTFTVFNDYTGCEASASLSVTSTGEVPVSNAGSPQEINCDQLEVTLNGQESSQGSNFTYNWTTTDGNIVSGATTLTPIVDAGGEYTLVVINTDNGCESISSVIVSESINMPVSVFELTQNEDVITLTDNSEGTPSSWLWEFGDGTTSTEQNPSHTYTSSGVYQVCLTITNECGTNTSCKDVTVVLEGLNASSTVASISCFGAANGNIDLVITGGIAPYEVSWTGPNGYTSTDLSISNLVAGTYVAEITDADGEIISQSFDIVEPSQIILSALDILDNECNGDANGSASIEVSGGTPGYTYLWSNGSTENTVTGLNAGNYEVTILDANQCILEVQNISVGEPTAIAIEAEVITDASSGQDDGSINFEITGGSGPYVVSLQGSTEAIDLPLTGLAPGSYSFDIVDANGCTAVAGPFDVNQATSVSELEILKNISLAPNPAQSYINLEANFSATFNGKISILNNLGQLVYVQDVNSSIIKESIDLSAMAQGVYILSIANAQGQTSRKFIVQ